MPATIFVQDAAVLHGDALRIPGSAHTLRGFRSWAKSAAFPRRGRISFIAGEIHVDMSPEELETHNKVKTEVGSTVHRLGRKLKLGEFYSDGTLVTNPEAGVSHEPDGTFVLWDSCLAKMRKASTWNWRAAPTGLWRS